MDLPQIDPTLRIDAAYPSPGPASTRATATSNDGFSHLLNAKLRERTAARNNQPDAAEEANGATGPETDATDAPAAAASELHDDELIELVCVDEDDADTGVDAGQTPAALALIPDVAALPVVPLALPLAPVPEAPVLTGLDFSLDAQLRSAGVPVAALDTPPSPSGVATAPDTSLPLPEAPAGEDDEDSIDFALLPPTAKPVAQTDSGVSTKITQPQDAPAPTAIPAVKTETLAGSTPVAAQTPAPQPAADIPMPIVAAAAPVDAKPAAKPVTKPVATASAGDVDTDSSAVRADTDAMPADVKLTVAVDRPVVRPAPPPIAANQSFFAPADASASAAPQQAEATNDASRPATDLFATAMKELKGDDTVTESDKQASTTVTAPQTNAAPAPQAAQQAAPVAEATTAATNRPMVHPVVEQVVMHIAKAAGDQADRIKIELRPIELGRIDVRMEIGPDGRVQAVFAADRPQTMELLQRDSRQLQSALQDAGLNVDSGSLSFDLRGNGNGNGGSNSFANNFTPARGSFDVPPELVASSQAYAAPGSGAGRLDIRV